MDQFIAAPSLPLYLTDPALHGLRESLGLIYTPMMSDEDDDDGDDDDDVDDVDLDSDDADVGADHSDHGDVEPKIEDHREG